MTGPAASVAIEDILAAMLRVLHRNLGEEGVRTKPGVDGYYELGVIPAEVATSGSISSVFDFVANLYDATVASLRRNHPADRWLIDLTPHLSEHPDYPGALVFAMVAYERATPKEPS